MPSCWKLTCDPFTLGDEFSVSNCVAVTVLTSAVGSLVAMRYQRKSLSEYSIWVPIILFASASPQHEIVRVGSSRLIVHLPQIPFGIDWDDASCTVPSMARTTTIGNLDRIWFLLL